VDDADPRRRSVLAGLAGTAAAWIIGGSPGMAQAPTSADIAEMARRATVFFFPLYEMWRTRWNAILNPGNPRRTTENMFGHARMLADHRSRAVTTPNNDTLYSSAWLDLSQGPLVLTVPDTADRYYSLAFMDAWTNNFAYVGRRTTGTRTGRHFVAGPDWSESPPPDHGLIHAPTNLVWLLGRTLVDGPQDLSAATALMQRYTLAPSGDPRLPSSLARQDTAVPADPGDVAAFFDIIRRAWVGNEAPSRDQPELEVLAPLSSLWMPDRTAPTTGDPWPALATGHADARRAIRGGPALGGGAARNGWTVPPRTLGNFGTDYGLRAVVALTGLAALEPAEAMYMTANVDSEGRPLDGINRYSMRFERGALPPVDAFWSLSMYELTPEGRAFFADNPLNRYAVGDRSKHLRYGDDGSLELYLQKESPGSERQANWLPAPTGRMRLTLRAYQPRADLLDGRYAPPQVRRVG
jgi:hypothetical protein